MSTDGVEVESPVRIGQVVREHRNEMGLSAKNAARQAGVAYGTWLRIEGGKTVRDMSLSSVDRLFGLPVGTARRANAGKIDLRAELAKTPAVRAGSDASRVAHILASIKTAPLSDLARIRDAVEVAIAIRSEVSA